MAKRLLAHARMCQEVADECGNKELAADFNKLALECIQAAAACKEQRTCGTMRVSFYVKTRQCPLRAIHRRAVLRSVEGMSVIQTIDRRPPLTYINGSRNEIWKTAA